MTHNLDAMRIRGAVAMTQNFATTQEWRRHEHRD